MGEGEEAHEEEASAVGRGALPRKLPWREVVELRRGTMEFAMYCGVATAPTSPPWGSGEEEREGAGAAGLDLDLGEECLHCSELAVLSALPCARAAALPLPPPPSSPSGSNATPPLVSVWDPMGQNAACLFVLGLHSSTFAFYILTRL